MPGGVPLVWNIGQHGICKSNNTFVIEELGVSVSIVGFLNFNRKKTHVSLFTIYKLQV